MSHYSVIEYFAEHEGYRCGYCKSPNTNYSNGMWAHSLTVTDYQDLIDRGWRRSGKYCYKPVLSVTCCPMYTIKCNAKDFKLSKSHKKILKRMKKFLTHGKREKDQAEKVKEEESTSEKDISDFTDSSYLHRVDNRIQPDLSTQPIRREKPMISEESIKPSESHCKTEKMEAVTVQSPTPIKGLGADPSKPSSKKAKDLRKERKLQKLLRKTDGASMEDVEKIFLEKKKVSAEPKMLEDFLTEPENPVHKLEVRLVPCDPRFEEFEKTLATSYSVYTSYQTTIHKETIQECDIKTFTDFLVTSPLEEEPSSSSFGYGSFHHQYWLDGKLIAVGVIDILPKCVSSVYLFYDPEYSFLSLGTYAALREIELVRKLNRVLPELKYYYMGFYIHSCVKMRYKANFQPSYLLCPETYSWNQYEKCKLKLDVTKYSRFEDDTQKDDEDSAFNEDSVLVLHARKVMTYSMYRQISGSDDKDEVQQYAKLVGRKCYRRMLLYRS